MSRIDDLQYEYMELFEKVKEFAGLRRPKHHFLAHLSRDVWLYGPSRGYWCFGFEGFNRVIKAGGKRSNYKDESVSVMRWWSMKSARVVVLRARTRSWFDDELCA